jgi:hypothetical protein
MKETASETMKIGFVEPSPESSAVEKPDMESPAEPSVKNATAVESTSSKANAAGRGSVI